MLRVCGSYIVVCLVYGAGRVWNVFRLCDVRVGLLPVVMWVRVC